VEVKRAGEEVDRIHAAVLNAKRHGAPMGDTPVPHRLGHGHVQVVHDVSRSGAGRGRREGRG
jgi:hypothetical protein